MRALLLLLGPSCALVTGGTIDLPSNILRHDGPHRETDERKTSHDSAYTQVQKMRATESPAATSSPNATRLANGTYTHAPAEELTLEDRNLLALYSVYTCCDVVPDNLQSYAHIWKKYLESAPVPDHCKEESFTKKCLRNARFKLSHEFDAAYSNIEERRCKLCDNCFAHASCPYWFPQHMTMTLFRINRGRELMSRVQRLDKEDSIRQWHYFKNRGDAEDEEEQKPFARQHKRRLWERVVEWVSRHPTTAIALAATAGFMTVLFSLLTLKRIIARIMRKE